MIADPEPNAPSHADPRNPANELYQASIAISLRRIADTLELIADYLPSCPAVRGHK